MLRALLLTLSLFTGLTQAAPILRNPISLDTGQGVLQGSLMLPQRSHALPVALLIAGSGPTDRNGNNPGGGHNDSLRRLAQVLAQHGIASVRYDKRGIAASHAATPHERDLSVERYVADAVAWGRKLQQDKRFNRLILIGHSEGALIASLAAPEAGADALIAIAGSARPIDQLLQAQLRDRLPPRLRGESDALLAALREGRQVPEVTDELTVLFRPSVQPYLISLFRQDPAAAFARVRVPALILQGDHDIQVSVQDAKALQAAKPDAQLQIVGGMNHVMRIVPLELKAQLASYDNPDLPLARALTEGIVRFIETLPPAENGIAADSY
ncbi:alpha/beta hydrolase [Phytopseudomonas dryadis]|uniref:Alpha/beta hydrolase n=1 Tax=Phytopseudomonas dryadis TaxID=2487520 RepID=A0A4Q9QX98_9GAMM|nr:MULTISPECIES: alpha/beta fold hydrolase [Pseudomonas]TBU88984.1 alpha/beta hydrolase [Pseudomonas dryadis]TBV08298.1 alpha/beta hydrolase [Pseudomonas dryadis]TBV19699.1 alpha/beta hydrolase [Pseudomonas sp. FRB 230]